MVAIRLVGGKGSRRVDPSKEIAASARVATGQVSAEFKVRIRRERVLVRKNVAGPCPVTFRHRRERAKIGSGVKFGDRLAVILDPVPDRTRVGVPEHIPYLADPIGIPHQPGANLHNMSDVDSLRFYHVPESMFHSNPYVAIIQLRERAISTVTFPDTVAGQHVTRGVDILRMDPCKSILGPSGEISVPRIGLHVDRASCGRSNRSKALRIITRQERVGPASATRALGLPQP